LTGRGSGEHKNGEGRTPSRSALLKPGMPTGCVKRLRNVGKDLPKSKSDVGRPRKEDASSMSPTGHGVCSSSHCHGQFTRRVRALRPLRTEQAQPSGLKTQGVSQVGWRLENRRDKRSDGYNLRLRQGFGRRSVANGALVFAALYLSTALTSGYTS